MKNFEQIRRLDNEIVEALDAGDQELAGQLQDQLDQIYETAGLAEVETEYHPTCGWE